MPVRLIGTLGDAHVARALVGLLVLASLCACAAAPAPTTEPAPQASAATPLAAAVPALATPAPTQAPSPTPRPAATAAPTVTPTPAERYDLVLTGATLIDGTGAAPLPDAVVTIRAGKIAAVGPAGAVAYDPASPTRDLRGATLLPGFINVHVHTSSLSLEQLKRWTSAGVTTVRDLAGPRDLILARRREVAASGDPALPRLLVAGPMITVPGGHPIPIYGLSDEVLTVDGPDDARQKILVLEFFEDQLRPRRQRRRSRCSTP